MDFWSYVNRHNASTSFPDTNSTECDEENLNYLPTVQEYQEALGGYWVAMVVIGSVATVIFYALFIQQLWFTYHNAHKVYRLHIYWLISTCPFVAMMTTVSVIVPRTHILCTALKCVYVSIAVGHFADLTVLMYANKENMYNELKDTPMRINLLPLCCIYPCLPILVTTRLKLRVIKWMTYQMKWIQAIYFTLVFVIRTSVQHPDGTVTSSPVIFWLFFWMTVFNFASFLGGVWAMNIIGSMSSDKLERFRHKLKCLVVKVLCFSVKFQLFLLDCFRVVGAFPCLGPIFTPDVFQDTLENTLILVEVITFGALSYFLYGHPEFKELVEPVTPGGQSRDIETRSRDSGSSGSESAHGSSNSSKEATANDTKGGTEVLV